MPLISGIHRPTRRARTDVEKENKIQDEIYSYDGSNIDEEKNALKPHNNYSSDEEDNNEEDGFVDN